MRSLIVALALALAATAAAGPALAHPDHEDSIRPMAEEGVVRQKASGLIDTMIERKAIEPSWKGAAPAKVEYRTREAEWVVTFNNSRAADPAKRVLYVMFNPYGDYVAANHSGK
jgi:hypothetical protein